MLLTKLFHLTLVPHGVSIFQNGQGSDVVDFQLVKIFLDRVILDQLGNELALGDRAAVLETGDKFIFVLEITTVIGEFGLVEFRHVYLRSLS